MELKYILYAKVHKIDNTGESWTYKYQPTLDEYKKTMSFSVTTTDPYATLGKLDLPDGIGDVIIMDFKPKNVQDKLPKGEKKAVE